jgi:Protein of unknown function (DUF3558)
MRSTAALAMTAFVLMGCGASADDAGSAPPRSETTAVIPTDQPTAPGGGDATGSSEPVSPDRPLAGLDLCGLISGDEAAQLQLGEPESREKACVWPYTGESEDVVYAIAAVQHKQASLDDFVDLGWVPVPGKLGTHDAAVGAADDIDGLLCQVAVVVGESAVKVGTASRAFSSPDDPLCGDLSNELARVIEPKLPVVNASASGKKAGGKSGKDGALAQVQPCDLISDGDAAQLGLTNEAGAEQAGVRQCAWLSEGGGSPLSVILAIEDASIEEIVGDGITPVPSIGSHDAVTFTSAAGLPAVAIGVDDESRVEVQVGTMQLGESPDPSTANQLAMDVATLVEPNLP